jgi:hypothetical protein
MRNRCVADPAGSAEDGRPERMVAAHDATGGSDA